VLELVAGFSLFSGGGFGRWVGIFAAALASITALLSIPAYPFWSLCVFALSLIILYELATPPLAAPAASPAQGAPGPPERRTTS
jgi:hypothetical protein